MLYPEMKTKKKMYAPDEIGEICQAINRTDYYLCPLCSNLRQQNNALNKFIKLCKYNLQQLFTTHWFYRYQSSSGLNQTLIVY